MWRLVFFLALFANLVFYAWSQGYITGTPVGAGESGRLQNQIQADKLQVVSRDDGAAEAADAGRPAEGAGEKAGADKAADKPADKAAEKAAEKAGEKSGEKPGDKGAEKTAEKPAEKDADKAAEKEAARLAAEEKALKCILWQGLGKDDAELLKGRVAQRHAGTRVTLHHIPDPKGWWVFVPPLGGREAAVERRNELRESGVQDTFIIQEDGPNQWAISLGVFSSEEAAANHQAMLQKRGVRGVQAAERIVRNDRYTLEVAAPAAAAAAIAQTIRAVQGKARAEACPAR